MRHTFFFYSARDTWHQCQGRPRLVASVVQLTASDLEVPKAEVPFHDNTTLPGCRWGWVVESGAAGLVVVRAPALDGTLLTAMDLKVNRFPPSS